MFTCRLADMTEIRVSDHALRRYVERWRKEGDFKQALDELRGALEDEGRVSTAPPDWVYRTPLHQQMSSCVVVGDRLCLPLVRDDSPAADLPALVATTCLAAGMAAPQGRRRSPEETLLDQTLVCPRRLIRRFAESLGKPDMNRRLARALLIERIYRGTMLTEPPAWARRAPQRELVGPLVVSGRFLFTFASAGRRLELMAVLERERGEA